MISPHTPPGTKVIATRTTKQYRGKPGSYRPAVEGLGYVLVQIRPCDNAPSGFQLLLEETAGSWHCISAFRLPVTPEGLLSVPSEAPADLDRRTAPVSPRKRVRA